MLFAPFSGRAAGARRDSLARSGHCSLRKFSALAWSALNLRAPIVAGRRHHILRLKREASHAKLNRPSNPQADNKSLCSAEIQPNVSVTN